MEDAKLNRMTWWFVGFGLVARGIQYLTCAPLWHDELALVDALLQVDRPSDLLGPLANAQIAPPAFCLAQWGMIQAFGCGEYSMRLIPFVCSISALLGFLFLCRQTLPPLVRAIAVGIFAVSGNLIEYAADAKPYASDVAITIGLLILLHQFVRQRQLRTVYALAVCSPVALAFSLPSVFILAAIAIGLVLTLGQSWSQRGAAAVFIVSLVGSFATLLLTCLNHQDPRTLEFMQRFWADSFFPWQDPSRWPVWLAMTHTGELMAYPFGGARGASLLTTVAFALGVGTLIRQRTSWAWLCLLPFALCLVASAMHRYPYGQLNRTSVFLAPLVIVPAALGTASVLRWLDRSSRTVQPMLGYSVALYLIGTVTIVSCLAKPSGTRRDWQSRSFARWFWRDQNDSPRTICALTDLEVELNYTVDYRCHQRRYSRGHRNGRKDVDALVACGERLRIIIPEDPRYPTDNLAVWSQIEAKLGAPARVVSRQQFAVNPGDSLLCPIYHVVEVIVEHDGPTRLALRPDS